MRTLTTLFEAEKNKKTGASPVWILKIPFVAGTLYLSDRLFTYAGITITPWIASWGGIDEDISNSLTMPMVSDFSAGIIIDPDAATDIHDLLWSESVETLDCELYQWFEGLNVATDPMVKVWTGNIINFEKQSELVYQVDLVDQSVKVDQYPGRVGSLVDYSNMALDDVGYQFNILYGSVVKVPALRLDVGKKTSLIAAITAAAVDFYLTDGTGFVNGSDILIDGEQIHITTISTNHITACSRGYNSTTAAAHSASALVLEKKTTAVFLFADHPVKSIDTIYALRADGVPVDVTSLCTKYTGQGGANDLTGYAAMAVITCPGYITFNQAVALGLTDSITVSDNIAVTATTNVPSQVGVFYTGCPAVVSNSVSTDTATKVALPAGPSYSDYYLEICWFGTCSVLPIGASKTIALELSNGVSINLCSVTTAGIVPISASTQIVALGNQADRTASLSGGGGADGTWSISVTSVKICASAIPAISTSKSGAASKSGTVVLTNNNLTNFAVGDKLLVTGQGYQDGGAALIERPDLVIEHFLYTYAGWPNASFEHADAATALTADGYKFSAVINTRKKLKEWLAFMALQCRCWFRFAGGKAYLLYRTDTLTSDKTIAKFADNDDFTTTMRIKRSPLDEVVNVIHLYYQRDWTKDGREAYQAIIHVEDATSITAYGEKESADTFLFDFVRDATMADDLADFYLARYKDRKKVVAGEVYLDQIELEFADAVTLTEAGGILCEVRKVGVTPGNSGAMDKVILIAQEY